MSTYDAALAFQAPGSAAVTASGTVGTLPLDKMVNTFGDQRDKLGAQKYEIAVHVGDIAFVTDEDPNAEPPTVAESYTFTVNVGPQGETPAGVLQPTETGLHIIALDSATIEKFDPSRNDISLDIAVEGDAPSISFSAWIN